MVFPGVLKVNTTKYIYIYISMWRVLMGFTTRFSIDYVYNICNLRLIEIRTWQICLQDVESLYDGYFIGNTDQMFVVTLLKHFSSRFNFIRYT